MCPVLSSTKSSDSFLSSWTRLLRSSVWTSFDSTFFAPVLTVGFFWKAFWLKAFSSAVFFDGAAISSSSFSSTSMTRTADWSSSLIVAVLRNWRNFSFVNFKALRLISSGEKISKISLVTNNNLSFFSMRPEITSWKVLSGFNSACSGWISVISVRVFPRNNRAVAVPV